jgi:hypothetical protein
MRRAVFLAFFFVSAAMFFLTSALHAQAVISEIMYDFPGTEGNGDHDWIEVRNAGTGTLDISGYRFFEANTNHTLKLDRGSAALLPGAFAVIANATSTFLLDYPAFRERFDSSFNLNSIGELLVCSAPARGGSVVDDSLTYSPLMPRRITGLSCTDAGWAAAVPTPGNTQKGHRTNSCVATLKQHRKHYRWNTGPTSLLRRFCVRGKDRPLLSERREV